MRQSFDLTWELVPKLLIFHTIRGSVLFLRECVLDHEWLLWAAGVAIVALESFNAASILLFQLICQHMASLLPECCLIFMAG